MQPQPIIKKPPSPEAVEKVHQFVAKRREMIISRLLERKNEGEKGSKAVAP
mgnify:CR=1 FL=1